MVKGRNSIIISGIVLAFIAGTFVSGTQVFGAAQSGWQAAVTELQQEFDDLFGDIGDLEDDLTAETIERIAGDADVLLEAQNDLIIHADDPSAHHDSSSLTIKQSLVDETFSLEHKIFDPDVTPNSVVIISIDEVIDVNPAGCGTTRVGDGFFAFSCIVDNLVTESSVVNYIVINDED